MTVPLTLTERRGGLYGYLDDPSSWYQHWAIFAERVTQLSHRFAPNGQKLAIWGCGLGYLVDEAVTLGYDAYGFDVEPTAISDGQAEMQGIAARLFVRDCTVAADVTAAKSDAGIHGNKSFDLLMTEDLLTCITDAEISVALPLLRGISQANLLHLLTPTNPIAANQAKADSRLTWKTKAQWAALLEPPDVCVDANGVQF